MPRPASKKSDASILATIEAIRTARALIAEPIEEVAYKFRAGHQIRVRQAQDDLPALHSALNDATVPSRLVGVFAEGDAAAITAAALIVREGGISVDAGAIWSGIAATIEGSLGPQRQWSSTQWHLMMQGVAEEARKHGFTDMTALPMENDVQTADVADVTSYIRRIVAASDIPDLQLRALRSRILEAVISDELTSTTVPVLVTGASTAETAALRRLFARAIIHTFAPDATATREALVEILKSASPN